MKNGSHVHILHNPKAGEQDNTKKELMRLVQPLGFSCDYASVKEKGWQRFKRDALFLLIVGGDGTVRAVAGQILRRKLLEKRLPLLLLPAGTANNIAAALGISHDADDVPARISLGQVRALDVGTIAQLPKTPFFLEGMGFGLFPELIKTMKEADVPDETREQELEFAMDKLLEIIPEYQSWHAEITIDGQLFEGEFLLIEILNISSIGPNLCLAPDADPGDGILHVALLRAAKRDAFLTYLEAQRDKTPDQADTLPWELVELRHELQIKSETDLLHVDDELLPIKPKKRLQVGIRTGVLDIVL